MGFPSPLPIVAVHQSGEIQIADGLDDVDQFDPYLYVGQPLLGGGREVGAENHLAVAHGFHRQSMSITGKQVRDRLYVLIGHLNADLLPGGQCFSNQNGPGSNSPGPNGTR